MNAITSTLQPTHPDNLHLSAHVRDCRRACGRSFVLQCVGERVHAVLGPRLVTTVLAAAMLMALLLSV